VPVGILARRGSAIKAGFKEAGFDGCSVSRSLSNQSKKCSIVMMVVVMMVVMAALRLHVAMVVMMMVVLRDLHIGGLFGLIPRSCAVGCAQHGKRIWDRIEELGK
jgi:hypothetical protein